MSSRCVYSSSNLAGFYVFVLYSGNVGAINLYLSDGRGAPRNYSFRPVITLNSNVQLDVSDTVKDGTSAQKAWIIK